MFFCMCVYLLDCLEVTRFLDSVSGIGAVIRLSNYKRSEGTVMMVFTKWLQQSDDSSAIVTLNG